MSDNHVPAIEIATYNDAHKVQFSCLWNGAVRTETLSGWSKLTGINRNTIKSRFYMNRTPRECLGLDKIEVVRKSMNPRCSVKKKEARQAAIANQFLCGRW